jgi:glutamine amidotransferase
VTDSANHRGTPGRGAEDVPRIVILDYGMGNLRSVEKALWRVGAEVTITADPAQARAADGLILPGVGAFPAAMERIRALGIDRLIDDRQEIGKPILGICLGLQLIFSSSTELGGADGLGVIDGEVTELRAEGLKVPHIGWSPVRWERSSRLTDGIASETPFYFVHSFAPRPAPEVVLGTAAYGERFACAVECGGIFGVQFHPEKSSVAGLRVLSNFARICAGAREAEGTAPTRA